MKSDIPFIQKNISILSGLSGLSVLVIKIKPDNTDFSDYFFKSLGIPIEGLLE